MSDIVNQFFHKHYPPNLDRHAFQYSGMLGGMWEYNGPERYSKDGLATLFPPMHCADGFCMSVQGHWGAYSHPRDDFADVYTKVEVGFPSAREELLMPYIDGGDDSDPLESVYGYVPLAVIEKIVTKHGGLVDPPKEQSDADPD